MELKSLDRRYKCTKYGLWVIQEDVIAGFMEKIRYGEEYGIEGGWSTKVQKKHY